MAQFVQLQATFHTCIDSSRYLQKRVDATIYLPTELDYINGEIVWDFGHKLEKFKVLPSMAGKDLRASHLIDEYEYFSTGTLNSMPYTQNKLYFYLPEYQAGVNCVF